MPLALLRRLVRHLLGPEVVLQQRRLPRGIYGVVCAPYSIPWCPVIFYARGLSAEQRARTVLHECCHALFDCWALLPSAERGLTRIAWREDRADRFAEHVLELVASGATPSEIRAIRGDHPVMQRPLEARAA